MIEPVTTLMSLLLTLGAVARVTRLVNRDVLLDKPRAWLLRRLVAGGHDQLAYLVVCPWCLSMYIGAAFAGAWSAWGSHTAYMAVCLALTASYATGALGSKENE